MSADATVPARGPGLRISLRGLENGVLWLVIVSGAVVLVEPSPYELAMPLALVVFIAGGLAISLPLAPLLLLIIVFNCAGTLALIPYFDDDKAVFFIGISWYMGFTSIIFAALVTRNTLERLEVIRAGWITGAVIASLAAIAGYFDIAGASAYFSLYGRGSGTFKDPNVLGPFLAVPATLLVQSFLLGDVRRPLLSLGALIVILAGIFLSFSRGAWGVTAAGFALCALLTTATAPSVRLRTRIVFMGLVGVCVLGILLALALSIDSVRAVFEQRAVLLQDYDSGAQGRFGQIEDMAVFLLDNPIGWGPMQVLRYFVQAPHNVYVNAFGVGGWLGGASYLALIGATLYVGWSTLAVDAPWRTLYIGFWSAAFIQILQGVQIDTDHWRHFWLLLGLVWGVGVASRRYRESRDRPAGHGRLASPGQAL